MHASGLLTLESEWGLFTQTERRVLQAYRMMRRLRLYKFNYLSRRLTERIRAFVPQRQSNIGRIKYLSP